jgi:hypothetical protein
LEREEERERERGIQINCKSEDVTALCLGTFNSESQLYVIPPSIEHTSNKLDQNTADSE